MRVHGDWLLTADRAAVHLPTATAVVADLHLGYDQARLRGGEAVPLTSLEETQAALARLFDGHAVRRLMIAGDLIENRAGEPLVGELRNWLRKIGVAWTGLVPGNHDRGLAVRLPDIPVFPDGVELGEWRVVHGDGPLPAGRRVLGHFHPCLRWGRIVSAPCYLIGREELILPAFSADAAGVNVFGASRWQSYRCAVIAGREVLDFGQLSRRKTSADRRSEDGGRR